MPRVNRDNRDLQRRLAARRGRDRRRPVTEQRYRFAEPVDAPVEPPTEADAELFDSAPEMFPPRETEKTARPPARTRTSGQPFAAYAADYAYVGQDLRRIAVVIGSLLVLLIVLHFVLPR